VLDPDNGTAYEGRRTDVSSGHRHLYLFVDDAFIVGTAPPFELKVTYIDAGTATWRVEYEGTAGPAHTATVTNTASDTVKTATFTVTDAVLAGGLTASADLRITATGGQDLEVRFVRLVRREPPGVFADGFESGNTMRWATATP
jgi:hypothetical protein